MSYSPLGIWAGTPEYCEGGKVSWPDGDNECCPVSSWNNTTYRHIKGSTSLRRWDELRIRRIADQLLNTSLKHGTGSHEGESGLERILYDSTQQSLQLTGKEPVLAPGFVEGLRRAVHVFVTVFPWSRWYYKGDCERDEQCQADGYYGCYRTKPVAFDAGSANVLATVVPLTAADREKLYRSQPLKADASSPLHPMFAAPAAGWSKPLQEWLQKAEQVIDSVPGGRKKDPKGSYKAVIPVCADVGCVPKENESKANREWLQWNGNVLGPKAWLQSFIDVFGKRRTINVQLLSKLPSIMSLKKKPQLTLAARPGVFMQVGPKRAAAPARDTASASASSGDAKKEKKEDKPEPDEEGGFPTWGLVAIGAGVAGAAYFVMRDNTGAK